MSSDSARTFVVTGATSGIGLALAQELSRSAGRLVIVGRDESRLQAAVADVRSRGHGGLELIPILADLSSLVDDLRLAEQLDRLSRIDVLIHNAGLLPARLRLTHDGFEESFATNHLAPFVLNRLLRQRLIASAPARVVQISAGLALSAVVDLEGDPYGARFNPLGTYSTTKLWNLLATLDLAGRLEGTGVTVNAVHPGVVRTRLGEGAPGIPDAAAKRGWPSPELGAQGPSYLATAAVLEGVTGRFFNQTEEASLSFPVELERAVERSTMHALTEALPGRELSRIESDVH